MTMLFELDNMLLFFFRRNYFNVNACGHGKREETFALDLELKKAETIGKFELIIRDSFSYILH